MTPETLSNIDIDHYAFTKDDQDPKRVVRMELEMVNFTLKITVGNGDTTLLSDPVQVQELLDRARAFNGSTHHPTKDIPHDTDGIRKDGGIVIEVTLDPVNTVNSFHIPA
jgi:hypothetical protein